MQYKYIVLLQKNCSFQLDSHDMEVFSKSSWSLPAFDDELWNVNLSRKNLSFYFHIVPGQESLQVQEI